MSDVWPSDHFEIDLHKIDPADLGEGRSVSRHGYAPGEIQEWVEELSQVQHLRYDKGWEDADFEHLRESERPEDRALAKTYHQFYDPHHVHAGRIQVYWDGSHYRVDNGKHRLAAAQGAGLRHVPAHVYAPDRETLNTLRAESNRVVEEERTTTREPWERPAERGRDAGQERSQWRSR